MNNEGYLFDPARIAEEKASDLLAREEKFRALAPVIGKEGVEALLKHYEFYDDRYYVWLANLYDPGEYGENGKPLGGGFYFSNSGRDNPGFGVDIESTMQALHFLKSDRSGFITDEEGGLKKALPKKMQEELVAFARSLQSPEDGYFYHPQWESVLPQRRGRDLRWATQLFEVFGESPDYDTPGGVKGVFGPPRGKFGGEETTLCPDARAWTGSDQLSALEKWETYLEEQMKTAKDKSWHVGNLLSAQYMEIKGREKLAIENGELVDADGDGIADGGYVRTLERIVNSYQLENGLWQLTPDGKPTFYGVNGLMKLSELYTNLGLRIERANAALAAALEMAMHEGVDSDGKDHECTCDVFNPLVALRNLVLNLRKFGDGESADRLQEGIRRNAVEIIEVCTRKLRKYKKNDGSIGYSVKPGSGCSQCAPVALPYTDEGSINGADIATGVSSHLCLALGIPIMPMFTPADFKIFLNIINSREHLKK